MFSRSPALFFPALFRNAEIRELSVRGRPERGWSRRDHAVHDARGRARRQVLMFYNVFRFVFCVALSRLNLQSKCRQKRTCGRVESGLSLSLCAIQRKREKERRAHAIISGFCESSFTSFRIKARVLRSSVLNVSKREKLNGPFWHLIDRHMICDEYGTRLTTRLLSTDHFILLMG